MNENSKYLKKLLNNIVLISHPKNKNLIDFINNKLSPPKKEKIIEHLIYCDECFDTLEIIIKYIKKSNK